ncbi:glycosyl transferase family protein [Mangrovitalea sediminis]|uniref:glycosyl transferase family protein n=1 Tax=Mangrovitalea sediminis TaxID=1982043 RepID=UPI000BE4BCC6|nr:glycosyl transferase family protein [Mangrovitalea sediminis]
MSQDETSNSLPEPKPGEHPFAPYVRILGKGKRGSRALSRAEARHAMSMILKGEVEQVQLGAFLMLLRVKEEVPEELAGFADAARDYCRPGAPITVDIDWPSYAGKRRHAPWFIFAIQLLADAGLRVFIHGDEGHTPGRIYTSDILRELGLEVATDWYDAARLIDLQGFCYLPLEQVLPTMSELIDLRPILGLRSPVHSLARLLNPLDAPLVMQGIFHPPYAPLHQAASQLLGYERAAVIKGEGGEIERNPDTSLTVYQSFAREGSIAQEDWPPMFERRHVKPDNPGAGQMRAVWNGTLEDEYATGAIVGTAALALKESGRANTQAEALAMAEGLWQTRDRSRF